ncbi:MAG: saccharopine dehydrogenase [Myxococcales bacterium]|nr:saccharopine dehydrogenase [Myxococcales bacterium]
MARHDARVIEARAKPDRPFDIVLFGATGYTGELVCAELLLREPRLKWAIAGRDRTRLEAVRARLANSDPRALELPILIGDSHQPASLDAIARQTRVVCSTVGPYAKYGSELVAAAVDHGTDYCDITGEVQWVRRMIDTHHEAALRSGARIVPCCGFDSIPSDLGVFLMQLEMRARHSCQSDNATLYVTSLRGGASGGTIASMLGIIEEARRDPTVRALLLEPYSLNPEGERSGPDGRDALSVERDRDRNCHIGPFVMAAVNTRVVRRSNALLGWRYGREFRYREVMQYAPSVRGGIEAQLARCAIMGFLMAVSMGPARRLVERLLPKPGAGPTAEERERGHFRLEVVGRGQDARGAEQKVVCRVEGSRDPGYGSTAIMLSEAALCLAFDAPTDGLAAGLLTPASAMGMSLVTRLRAAGMVLQVEPAT